VSKKRVWLKNESTLDADFDPADETFGGLCSTCKHAKACTYPRDPRRPVVQCDEFEGIREASEKAANANPGSVKMVHATRPQAERKYLGLCRICEKRETCTFPKPEGGVWHCEEYE